MQKFSSRRSIVWTGLNVAIGIVLAFVIVAAASPKAILPVVSAGEGGNPPNGPLCTVACPDMNHDTYVDASDLAAFAAGRGSQSPAADFNNDGVVNDGDQGIIASLLGKTNFNCDDCHWSWAGPACQRPSCPDMNHDTHVDASDLAAFAQAKSTSASTGDFNNDGVVDGLDQAILVSYFGASDFHCPACQTAEAPPPEPVPPIVPNDEHTDLPLSTTVHAPREAATVRSQQQAAIVAPEPHVTIAKTDNKTSAAPGEKTTYQITVSNSGDGAASGVRATDTLPGNYGTITDISDAGALSGNQIVWNNLTVPANGTKTVSFSGVIASSLAVGTTTLTNSVSLGCSVGECAFSGTATDTTTVTVNPVAVKSQPALSILKTVDANGSIVAGQQVKYTVTVTNNANATDSARNVVVTDTLPAGFSLALDGTSSAKFFIGDLVPGQSSSVSYDVKIADAQQPGPYDNQAVAKGDNTDPITASSSVSIKAPVVLTAVSGTDESVGPVQAVKVLAATGPRTVDYAVAGLAALVFAAGFLGWKYFSRV